MAAYQTSGRGGAGNIVDKSKTPQLNADDLQTPTLKTTGAITTGRGGTGNFAAGLNAEEKRRRQDVEPVIRRLSHGATHIGRGGNGNVVKAGASGNNEDGSGSAAVVTPPGGASPALTPTAGLTGLGVGLEKTLSNGNGYLGVDWKGKEKEKERDGLKGKGVEKGKGKGVDANANGRNGAGSGNSPPGSRGGSGEEEEDGDDIAVPARKPEEVLSWAEKGRNLLFGKR